MSSVAARQLRPVRRLLRRVPETSAGAEIDAASVLLTEQKAAAVALGDEALAKEIWCIESALDAHRLFRSAFAAICAGEYFEGWCTLEQAEITIGWLRRHLSDVDTRVFHVEFVAKHVRQWQELFPYRVFFSTELIEKKISCGICGARRSPRSSCGHRVGEIYGGEMCVRRIEEAELLGMAMVSNPVHKYTAARTIKDSDGTARDHHDYSLVEFVAQRLRSPYHEWSMRKTRRRHPHRNYRAFGPNDKCPCDSGKKYKRCCLSESGVLGEHVQLSFAEPVPPGLPEYVPPRIAAPRRIRST